MQVVQFIAMNVRIQGTKVNSIRGRTRPSLTDNELHNLNGNGGGSAADLRHDVALVHLGKPIALDYGSSIQAGFAVLTSMPRQFEI